MPVDEGAWRWSEHYVRRRGAHYSEPEAKETKVMGAEC
jgi:hypothetical protein